MAAGRVKTAYLFLIPSICFFAIFYYLSIGVAVYDSFFFKSLAVTKQPVYVKLGNYFEIFQRPMTIVSLKVTLLFWGASLLLLFAIPLSLALILYKKTKFVTLVKIILFFPALCSLVMVAYSWKYILDPRYGFLNGVLLFLKLPTPDWFGPNLALASVVIVFTWWLMGYNLQLFTAGVENIPREYYEAACLDGANKKYYIRYIVLPLLRPTMVVVVLMTVLYSFQCYTLVYIMTAGGPFNRTNLYPYAVWIQAFAHLRVGLASAMTVFMASILLGLSLILIKIIDIRVEY